jgi:hypothetical protein
VAFLLVVAVVAVVASAHLFSLRRSGLDRQRTIEICLLYVLAGVWGIGAALLALPHIFFPDYVAGYVGWEPGSPFQVELGFANLGRAILGILCIWYRGSFWVAPIVTNTVFGIGAAYVHVQEMIEHANFSEGNAGPVVFLDVLVPVVAIILFIAHTRARSSPAV